MARSLLLGLHNAQTLSTLLSVRNPKGLRRLIALFLFHSNSEGHCPKASIFRPHMMQVRCMRHDGQEILLKEARLGHIG